MVKVGYLSLLHDLFDEVVIPEAVYAELNANENFAHELQEISKNDYIVCRSVANQNVLAMLQRVTGLHPGESEALALAEELHADLLLVDDLLARKTADNMHIRKTGSLGILKAGYMRGFLSKDDVVSCLAVFRENNLYISDVLYEQLLNEINA